ncbi:hypothetical protein [Bacillus sp. JCM 19041]|uniref:hypothetical protein n=1 Tax=Bacillus sp. JCM 19041 TaxID=1460637 RepID=UPI0006CFA2FB
MKKLGCGLFLAAVPFLFVAMILMGVVMVITGESNTTGSDAQSEIESDMASEYTFNGVSQKLNDIAHTLNAMQKKTALKTY